jgi:glycosyltransferase involved in cell wall biosynthesis
MKILLTMNLPYFPAHGGANNSNQLMLEALVQLGHTVSVVVPAFGVPPLFTPDQLADELAKENAALHCDSDPYRFNLRGVEVHAVNDPPQLRRYLLQCIAAFAPDVVVVSTEDPSQNLLAAALESGVPVVYLARTTSFLPFGPQAYFPSDQRSKLLEQVTAIVALSDFVAAYIKEWSGLHATSLPISFFGNGPFPDHGNFDRGFVTLINPCAVKGLPIFIELAKAFPKVPFAAVPTWGTTPQDRAALDRLDNVSVLPAEKDVDRIYSQTRVLLVPSLWAEARGRVVVEAMLRAIPVLASDVGGLPEAKLGTEFVIPVQPIERFTAQLDHNLLPQALVPPQDIAPWREALSLLLNDRNRYETHVRDAKQKASRYIESVGVAPLEALLRDVAAHSPRVVKPGSLRISQQGSAPESAPLDRFKDLSPAQQALLMRKLQEKRRSPASADETPVKRLDS